MSKAIGYSFWGFLADVKMDSNCNELSTPDGNAFYSWSIIREYMKQGYDVVSVMPDRDLHAVHHLGKNAFSAWCSDERFNAYNGSKKVDYNRLDFATCSADDVFDVFDRSNLNQSEYILHEWRMEIPSRNDIGSRGNEGWQPDLFLQDCIVKYCASRNVPLVIFDLDYKLTEEDVQAISDVVDLTVIELGSKWQSVHPRCKVGHVEIPFCFDCINFFNVQKKKEKLVYVGNRYERDWCIDKYFPKNEDGCVVYGNWNESGRDSKDRWPTIDFRGRLQTSEMHDAYSSAACTLLLAKKDYCDYGFMTARVIESVFYGAVPLFIEEYGKSMISKYAGLYSDELTVRSEEDVVSKMNVFFSDERFAKDVIQYLRWHLSFMDASEFVFDVSKVVH